MFNGFNDENYTDMMAEIRPVRKRKGFRGFIKNLFSKYLVTTLIGAIIGGLIVTYAAPYLTPDQPTKTAILQPNFKPVTLNLNGGTNPWDLVVQIAKQVSPSVVGITNNVYVSNGFQNKLVEQGSGSGIIISPDGYIVTNNHVIDGATVVMVKTTQGKQYRAQVIGADARTDLAVLKINATGLPAAKLGNSSELQVGELAVAIGNPLGDAFADTVTVGVISGLNRKLDTDAESLPLIQTDAAINPGNSGGPLVNYKGEVIGINSIKLTSTGSQSDPFGIFGNQGTNVEGMGFAISIDAAKPIIENLIKYGKIQRPMIGIMGATVTPELSKAYNMPVGIYVQQVQPGSPAEMVGLRPGDVITAVDGNVTKTIQQLQSIIEKHKVGDVVTVTVWRGGKSLNLRIKLIQAQ
ncbi:serine protease Do [Caldanaerobius fijiensis DSM 17918]|uniref:Serine protease Do n=1 Tax=Caldanaerobius fijiensis DSM 17918 TaxID=1121256 RepID=A0A1M4Z4K3_9THEO|nr:trypsin-like peptidase domain-containing protein [Caldanaerobius fijiensis]SHF12940.1 serine protease Do [Caldanaerobius fijiensis DSM 17918]